MAVAVTLPPSDRRHCEQRHSFDSFVVNVVTITSTHSFSRYGSYVQTTVTRALLRAWHAWQRCGCDAVRG
jgi:hypothetical protein